MEYFRIDKRHKDGLGSWCRACERKAAKVYRQNPVRKASYKKYAQSKKGKVVKRKACLRYSRSEKGKAAYKRRHGMIKSYLRNIFCHIENQCNHPEHRGYTFFGGRGIKCLFTFEEFYEHVTVDLGVTDIEQIEGLGISRIDKLGHFAKGNIQFATPRQLSMGTQKRRTYQGKVCSSKFKGVCWEKKRKKYHTKIHVDGKRIFLGYFSDEELAAETYDKAAKKYFGRFALTNADLGLL